MNSYSKVAEASENYLVLIYKVLISADIGIIGDTSVVKTFDHINKVHDTANGLSKDIIKIKKELSNPKLDGNVRKSLENTLSQASNTRDKARRTLKKVNDNRATMTGSRIRR